MRWVINFFHEVELYYSKADAVLNNDDYTSSIDGALDKRYE